MTTLLVTYAGDSTTRFDREYYVNTHLKLVRKAWTQYGLVSAGAYFPMGDDAGTIAVCMCNFRDEASMSAAMGSPETPGVVADVANFTPVKPTQSRMAPL